MKTVKVTIDLTIHTKDIDDEEQVRADILEAVIEAVEENTLDYSAELEEDDEEF